MIDESKTLKQVETEKQEQNIMLIKTNSAIKQIYSNADNAAIPLLKKQELIQNRIEELDLEIRVRTKKY